MHEDQSHRDTSTGLSRHLKWLIDPENRRILLPASGLWILALDWLLFSSNVVSGGLATLIVVVLGFLLGSAGTFFLQWRFARDAGWKAVCKSALAGVAVGAPWPLGGTLVGGWVLLYSGLGRRKRRTT